MLRIVGQVVLYLCPRHLSLLYLHLQLRVLLHLLSNILLVHLRLDLLSLVPRLQFHLVLLSLLTLLLYCLLRLFLGTLDVVTHFLVTLDLLGSLPEVTVLHLHLHVQLFHLHGHHVL